MNIAYGSVLDVLRYIDIIMVRYRPPEKESFGSHFFYNRKVIRKVAKIIHDKNASSKNCFFINN